jgi:hypothetical protein
METQALLNLQLHEINAMLAQGQATEAVEKHLLNKGMDTNQVAQMLVDAKRLRNAIRTRKGSLLVLFGILILGTGFISCVVLHGSGGSITTPLYGLTLIGLTIVLFGLIMIFN